MRESAWRRGWTDSQHFRETGAFFWLVEVVGAAVFGFAGVLVTPNEPTKVESGAFPAIGVVFGIVVTYVAIVFIMAARAPIVQRNEAWSELERTHSKPPFEIKAGAGASSHVMTSRLPNSRRAYLRLRDFRITNRSAQGITLQIQAQFFITQVGSFLADAGDEQYRQIDDKSYLSFPMDVGPHSTVIGTAVFCTDFISEIESNALHLDYGKTRLWIEEYVTGWSGILPLVMDPIKLLVGAPSQAKSTVVTD